MFADSVESPSWFKEISVEEAVKTNIDEFVQGYASKSSLRNVVSNEYYFISNNGEPLDKNELSVLTDNSVEQLPNEDGKISNVIALGKSSINGVVMTDYYFSEMEFNEMESFKENAIKVATNSQKSEYARTLTNTVTPMSDAPNYIDTYSWAIYDDINPSAIGGYLNSTVEYYKQGKAISGGKTVSVWDMKSFNQTEPINGYQTRQASSRHSVEAYVPDEKMISYGPTGDVGSSTVEVSLTGGVPTLTWAFNSTNITISDQSSMSQGFGKWTLNYVLGTTNAKSPYTYAPGIRAINFSGEMKFQHNHFGKFYKNLSAEATESTPLVVKRLTDL